MVTELLKHGWVKVKESKRDATEDDAKRKDVENEAKAAGKGLWNPHGPQVRFVVLQYRRADGIKRLASFITRCLQIHKRLYQNGKELI